MSRETTILESPGYLLRRVQRLALAQAEVCFQEQELSLSQWIALRLVQGGVGDTASALARNMCHDTGAITRLLDQLEERGLMQRTRSQEDRRVVTLSLTPVGAAAVAELAPRLDALWRELFTDFSAEEVETFTKLLVRLLQRLEAEDSPADIVCGEGR